MIFFFYLCLKGGGAMRGIFALLIALCIGSFTGCVTSETHEKSLGDLKQLRAQLAEEQASLANAQSLAAKEKGALSTQVAALDDEKATLSSDLTETKKAMAQMQSELDATKETLGKTEAEARSKRNPSTCISVTQYRKLSITNCNALGLVTFSVLPHSMGTP